MPSADQPRGTKRQSEEKETARLLKKKTKILGNWEESEEESEDFSDKLNRLFPRWWEEDQHEATCLCDFCKMYFGRVGDTDDEPDQSEPSSSSTTDKCEPPNSPAAA